MVNNLKNLFFLSILLCAIACRNFQRHDNKQNKLEAADAGSIVYKLDSGLSAFIADSIMNSSYSKKVSHCSFNTCMDVTEIAFNYQNDDIAPRTAYLVKNTQRFLFVNGNYLPIVFAEDLYADFSLVEGTRPRMNTNNWMDYAILQIDTRQKIIEYKNYYLVSKKDK